MTVAKDASNQPVQPIRVGHSPDPDDAFMFYALAKGKIDTGRYRFAHELVDIETLNRRALDGELELTAVSVHAYAYLSRPLRALFVRGEHGRPLRADGRRPAGHDAATSWPERRSPCRARGPPPIWPCGCAWAPISTTSSCRSTRFSTRWSAGEYEGRPVDAGLIIHEGQLTYADQRLRIGRRYRPMVVRADRPAAALGGQRHPQGPRPRGDPRRARLLAPEHRVRPGASRRGARLRPELRAGARPRARPTSSSGCTSTTGRSISARVGRQAVARLLAEGHAAGVIPTLVVPEFVG